MEIDDVKRLLGSYAELFNITVKEGYVIAKPKKRIAKEDFSEIGKLVKQEQGEYVKFDYSTKEGGHFKFKANEAISTATSDKKDIVIKDIFEYTMTVLKQVEEAREQVETIHKRLGILLEKLREAGY